MTNEVGAMIRCNGCNKTIGPDEDVLVAGEHFHFCNDCVRRTTPKDDVVEEAVMHLQLSLL